MSEEEIITYAVDKDGIAQITLNRPEKMNAFTIGMIEQWHDFLLNASDDPNVKVIIVTGTGRAFCAGGDTGAMQKRAGNESLERKDFLWRTVHSIPLLMERMDKPVIAAINGLARGAGMDMALMADIRIAAESATFAESYINMGLIAGDGGTYYLPRLIGLDRALELFWTAEVVAASEAEKMGLVTRVVPDDMLMKEAYSLARRIADQPTEAVKLYKRAVYQGMNMSLPAHLDMVSSHTSILRDTPEHRAKVAAFIASRKKRASAST
ncbi:MAG: enoyl-CoA hydratase/isomerase family protein [Rhodobacteraceae bacterium]|nr:enoyl-CoA hydratase/isomerase family protein [Paracoccaceae bacterium]